MSKRARVLILTREEHSYVANLEDVKKLLSNLDRSILSRGSVRITMNNESVRALGDILTNTLARVGFDHNYSLTREGKILESVIDKLPLGGSDPTL